MNRPFGPEARFEPLPSAPVETWLQHLESTPGAFCLESGLDVAGMGGWHFFGGYPVGEFIAIGDRWRAQLSGTATDGRSDALRACEAWYGEWNEVRRVGERSGDERRPPFLGGAVGYFGFELGEQIDPYPMKRVLKEEAGQLFDAIPDLHLLLYDEVVAIDAKSGAAVFVHRGRDQVEQRRWWREASGASPSGSSPRPQSPPIEVAISLDDAAFLQGVEAVRASIRVGDVYEVNLTRTHIIEGGPDPWTLHRRLRTLQPVPYGALLPWSPASVVSASPERFLRVEGDRVETRPIKGTIARGRSAAEDRCQGAALLADEKERAELAMIVDLVRNDLGRVARPQTVEVVEEASLETYATVIHTVATVAAILRADVTPFDLLRATFPGGSITGAPKLAALETIARLEPLPRKLYTGALGWLAPDGDLDLAIAIRTVLFAGGKSYFSVGGAVTWDSVPERELAELEAKGRAIFAAIRGGSPSSP